MHDGGWKRSGGFRRALARYPYGEGALWTMFLLSTLQGMSAGSDASLTGGGLFALAAIGVRATRQPREVERAGE